MLEEQVKRLQNTVNLNREFFEAHGRCDNTLKLEQTDVRN